MSPSITRLLIGYAVAASSVAAWTASSGSAGTTLRTLNVERINIREPDGTVRLVISGKAMFPGLVVKGKELPHATRRDAAGMIFFDDEGTEDGGLIFAGKKAGGVVHAGGHLSFDQYQQDQVLSLEQSQDGSDRTAGLAISDRPDRAMDFAAMSRLAALPQGAEKDAAVRRLQSAGEFGHPRLFLGKADNNATLSLRDDQGRKRLVLTVTGTGEAMIQFLDETGKVIKSVDPTGSH